MEQKYLPIGSVCTLKGKNKKVMITGYYSVEFNGNFKISKQFEFETNKNYVIAINNDLIICSEVEEYV